MTRTRPAGAVKNKYGPLAKFDFVLSDQAWLQATLPKSSDAFPSPGWGFVPNSEMLDIHFASSYYHYSLRRHKVFPPMESSLPPPDLVPPPIFNDTPAVRNLLSELSISFPASTQNYSVSAPKYTGVLAALLNKGRVASFLSACSPTDLVRVHSQMCVGPTISTLLDAIPSDRNLTVPSQYGPVLTSIQLGCSLPIHLPPNHCFCGKYKFGVDPVRYNDTIHLMKCGHNARIQTHNSVQYPLMDLGRAAHFTVSDSKALAHYHPGSNMIADVGFSPPLFGARSIITDITVVSPHSYAVDHPLVSTASLLDDSVVRYSPSACEASVDKSKKHAEAYERAGFDFMSFALDHYGAWCMDAQGLFDHFIGSIGSKFIPSNWNASSPQREFMQRIAVTLHSKLAESVFDFAYRIRNS